MKPEYNSIEHIKLLGDIIKRMANNHMKWLLTLFSIIAFGITIDKFFLDMENKTMKITALSISLFAILTIEIVALKSSWNFFDLENIYRKKQGEVTNGKWDTYDLIPKLKSGEIIKWKKSWIILVGIILICVSTIFNISLIIIASVN